MKPNTTKIIAAVLTVSVTFAFGSNPAFAKKKSDETKIRNHIQRWGDHCKRDVAEKFRVSQSDVRVSVGASERQAIDAGDITWDEMKRHGLSYNWEIRQRNGSADGYCNISGEGNHTEIVANNEDFRNSYSSDSNEDAKIEARIGRWGNNCKNRVAEQFDVPMSDIQVYLGATMQQSIDAGDITLNEIERYGLSFNWEVNSRYKSANGYCNTDGDGNVVEFRQ